MRNYVKTFFSTVWSAPTGGIFIDMNFAGSKADDAEVRAGWIESYQPTFPDVITLGPADCWVEADNKRNFLGILNNSRASLDFPQSGNIPAWIKFDQSPRSTGENSRTEKKGAKMKQTGNVFDQTFFDEVNLMLSVAELASKSTQFSIKRDGQIIAFQMSRVLALQVTLDQALQNILPYLEDLHVQGII
jgi:hypothetical protein